MFLERKNKIVIYNMNNTIIKIINLIIYHKHLIDKKIIILLILNIIYHYYHISKFFIDYSTIEKDFKISSTYKIEICKQPVSTIYLSWDKLNKSYIDYSNCLKKNYAVCIINELRSVKTCINSFYKHLIDPLDADIFILCQKI